MVTVLPFMRSKVKGTTSICEGERNELGDRLTREMENN